MQSPTRLAPFVGVGVIGGYATKEDPDANRDGRDNDDDGTVDELDEEDWDLDGVFGALYPEAGVHFWWSPRVRCSVTARYWFTTEGAAANDWLYGFSLALFD